MTMRALAVAACFLGAAISAHASEQEAWRMVDCNDSALGFSAIVRCSIRLPAGGGETPAAPIYLASIEGNVERSYVFAVAQTPTNGTVFQPHGQEQSLTLIRDIAGADKGVGTWGTYQSFGDTGFVPFKSERGHCVGFDHGGEKQPDGSGSASGYRYVVLGYFCETPPIADPAQRLRHYLSAMRVGAPKDRKNAFGAQVASFMPAGVAPAPAQPAAKAAEARPAPVNGPVPSNGPPTTAAAPRPAAAASAAAAKIETDLATLKSLHEKDLITREEYDAKRKEILGRM